MSTRPLVTATAAPRQGVAVASWPSIAAWGGGLILLALGAGASTAAEIAPPVRGVAMALVGAGAAFIGWGTAALVVGRIVAPRVGLGAAAAAAALAILAFVLDPVRMGILAVAPAIALLAVVGIACGRERRAPRGRSSKGAAPGRVRMAELAIAAVLAAAIVTPALAAVEAGNLAPAGGDVVIPDTGHHH
ncbi:hypothetical protein [Microbacterium sp. CIAB417]|uniref:hypothetical protein n=1 Tax=Microbacterium sp. CIAB417 TaxID=2860287 RepID=UPI001FAE5CBC|nr:hypothetical protein [Microbacterium sp. CIAB417]